MGFPVSEAYSLPMNAKFLLRSVMSNLCGSHYPLHMAMVEASSQRLLIYKAFSGLSACAWWGCHIIHIGCYGRCWERCLGIEGRT